MRILDDKTNKAINSVSIFLTEIEAKYLIGYLEQLVYEKRGDHSHLSSEDYKKEITICLYSLETLDKFHPRIQKLIMQDE
jgi:hypothetical protein